MDRKIVVAGAGSIGCFVGGLLSAAGRDVVLLARPRVAAELGEHGLTLSSFEGWTVRVAPEQLAIRTDLAEAMAGAALILVTLKSGDTAEMASLIKLHAPPEAVVVSLQNGLGNADLLRERLPNHRVLAGMVPFNVVQLGGGRLHKGTSGAITIEADPDVLQILAVPRLPVLGSTDMAAVLAGKLLLNLNNALNALSGLTLFEQLGDGRWRRILADCQAEALRVFKARGVQPWSLGPLPAAAMPRLLRLPTPLFRLLARSAVRIDRAARSSMAEDLERGRLTEIGELQGKVVELAACEGLAAPVNQAVLEAVKAAEKARAGSPRLRPENLLARAAS